jgi:amino acid transporter
VVALAGFASPLVVLITFAGSLCCALSIGQFAGLLPSAGWAYTYNSRGLGPAAGFLTGWMMIFAYALFVPAGVGLTSAFGSQLLASTLHVTIAPWALFIVVLTVAVFLAYLGITTSASVDLLLVAGEIAVIAALAITILVKIGPAHYSVAVLSPASSPSQRLTDLTDAMIYSFVVASVNAAIRIMYTMGRERALPGSLGRLSHRRTPVAAIGCLAAITLPIGLPLTYVYGGVPTFGYLAGIGGLPHLLIPAAASVVFLFPLWGILFPGAYTLANLLPFISLGWLLIGAIAVGILRARRPATFQALGGAVAPNLDKQLEPD